MADSNDVVPVTASLSKELFDALVDLAKDRAGRVVKQALHRFGPPRARQSSPAGLSGWVPSTRRRATTPQSSRIGAIRCAHY